MCRVTRVAIHADCFLICYPSNSGAAGTCKQLVVVSSVSLLCVPLDHSPCLASLTFTDQDIVVAPHFTPSSLAILFCRFIVRISTPCVNQQAAKAAVLSLDGLATNSTRCLAKRQACIQTRAPRESSLEATRIGICK